MSEGLAVFLIYETMRSADAIPRRVAARRFAWARVALAVAAAITVAALGYSTLGLQWKLTPSGDQLVKLAARNDPVGLLRPADTPALRDSYREALASVTGQRTIAGVDRPYLIDYRRFDIPNLDAPGFMTPDSTFPFFTGPGPKIAKLRGAGFDVLLVTEPNDEVCLNLPRMAAGARANGPSSGIYRRFLDWDQDIQAIEQKAPAAVRRFGTVLRIDLRLAQAELGG